MTALPHAVFESMKPIAVVQHTQSNTPGLFAQFCAHRGIALQVFRPYEGEDLPRSLRGHSGLCIMGGPMSANDDLPYLRQCEQLVREAISDDIPVIGHCLGGQLIARALGEIVDRAPEPEIGWIDVRSLVPEGDEWFGAARFPIYHWHHERFGIPAGATHLAVSDHCAPQAYALGGRHIGMQFHCEMTAGIMASWLDERGCQDDIERHSHRPAVQNGAAMLEQGVSKLSASTRVANTIYARWARNLNA